PKRSVVEQRSEVIKILSEGIENYRQAFAYEIDPHLQAKLFGRSDYRDVTVSDLADLMRDIESKVTRLPDGFGKDAFSHEQWNRIVDASVRVLAAMDTEKTAGPKFQEPVDGRFKTFYRLQRD